jgi:hypothetical protein
MLDTAGCRARGFPASKTERRGVAQQLAGDGHVVGLRRQLPLSQSDQLALSIGRVDLPTSNSARIRRPRIPPSHTSCSHESELVDNLFEGHHARPWGTADGGSAGVSDRPHTSLDSRGVRSDSDASSMMQSARQLQRIIEEEGAIVTTRDESGRGGAGSFSPPTPCAACRSLGRS